jgi:hypothetical protein
MFSQIEPSLKTIFGMRLSVKQLRQIIPRLNRIVDRPTRKTRRRCDIMEWMEANWARIEPTLREIAQKTDLLD